MEQFVAENTNLRPGFKELVAFCEAHAFPLVIATNGLDFYVHAVLRKHDLDHLPVYCVTTQFTSDGIQYGYQYATPACFKWGICKCLVLERFRQEGFRTVFIGDGLSDFCPAEQADFAFARSNLLVYCKEHGIRHQEFADFTDVKNFLEHNVIEPAGRGRL
jgi:2,3-diketo-5-methylthio-1-phosphopentane phosphatase